MLPAPQKYAAWLAVFRMYAGIFWLAHGIPKLLNPKFFGPNGMAGMVPQMSADTTGPYHTFLQTIVIPNYGLFSHLVAWGETLTGVSLLLGALTPVGGFVGMFLAINYWLMKGAYAQVTSLGGLDIAAFALSFVNVALPTGLLWGFDALFTRPRAKKPAAGES